MTAIFPYAKYTPEDSEEETYVSLKEKILKIDNNDYAYTRCEIVDFSGEWENGTVITEDMLREKATTYLKKVKTEPDINITLSYAQLKKTKDYKNLQVMENIALCDTVTVRIEKLGIDATAKVVKTKYDSLKERYESMEVGSVRTNLVKEITASQKETEELIKVNKNRAEAIRQQIEQTIKDVTAAITGNSGGHVVLYPEKNPQEIFILDTPDLNTAQNVWRWNLAGLGHSSTGVNGTFTTAITADGQIVADFITAGELTGAILKAGTVYAEALDIEYRNSVTKYTDDAKEEAINESITRLQIKNDSITAEVKRAKGIESELKAAIRVNADNITSCVTKGNVGSYITQYYNNVIVAFNNSSKYVQLTAGAMSIYNGTINSASLRSRFDEAGNKFWRDGYYVGSIGTNQWDKNTSHKGLVFDLEYQGKYMAWARQAEQASGLYTTVLCYSRAKSIYTEEGLHLGANVYGHNFDVYNVDLHSCSANGYTVTNNKKIPIVTEIKSNGNGSISWTTSSITVRNGMITGVPTGSSDI